MRFDPEYVACVLNDNFEDAKAQFIAPLMAIHYAHLVMLREQAIVPAGDAATIARALDTIRPDSVRDVRYDGTCEDLFFFIERLIVEACGEEAAGRLHTARSRNDIDMTMYRMR
ncbi:MAG: argininosuccinate lyase, partial [Acidobacteriota bacterium]